MSTIFIVEDDVKMKELLQSHIEKYGYKVVAVTNFDNVLEQFQRARPDLVILDVNLPKFDGYYWCGQIRASSNCPILFISARDEKMDQVIALEHGADDYITKPFYYEIVMAKIKGLLRRAYGAYSSPTKERIVTVRGLTLYLERMELAFHGSKVELTKKEMLLFETLMESPMRVVSRDALLSSLWENYHFVDENTLNVYIARVRRKLKDMGIENAIETVRGAGYRLNTLWEENI